MTRLARGGAITARMRDTYPQTGTTEMNGEHSKMVIIPIDRLTTKIGNPITRIGNPITLKDRPITRIGPITKIVLTIRKDLIIRIDLTIKTGNLTTPITTGIPVTTITEVAVKGE